ncbi:MAG: hypothetical protein QXD84_05590 [Thermoplasmata archaeon]
MKKFGEGRFDDGWVEVFGRGHNDPFHDWYLGPPLDFSHRLRAELIQSMRSSYVWCRMDEGALEFWLETVNSISWGTIDARTLLCPHDVLQLAVPEQRICDLSFGEPKVNLDPVDTLLNITFPYSYRGAQCLDYCWSCALGDIELEDPALWFWEGGSPTLSLSAASLPSGELVLRASPVGVEDLDPSNNEVRIAIHSVNESMIVSDETNLSGLWLLQPGVNASFQNGSFGPETRSVWIMGMGTNSIELSGCRLNVSSLWLEASEGVLRDMELLLPSYGIYDGVGRYRAQVYLGGGGWALEKVTAGCGGAEFAPLRELLLSDPGSFFEDSSKLRGCLRELCMDAEVVNLSILNSRVLARGYIELSAGCSLTLSGVSVVGPYELELRAPDVTLSHSDFNLLWSIRVLGNLRAEGNTFRTIVNSVSAERCGPGSSLCNNTFTSDLPPDTPISWRYGSLGTLGLYLEARAPPVLSGNIFSNLGAGILFSNASHLASLDAYNSFTDIRSATACHIRTVTLELDYYSLCLILNRAVSVLKICWSDCISAHERSYDLRWREGPSVSMRIELVDLATGSEATPRKLEAMCICLAALSPSGKTDTLEFSIPVRAEDAWSERIG